MLEESPHGFSGWKKKELAVVFVPWAEQSSSVSKTLSLGFLTVKCLWMTTDAAARLKVCVLPALLKLWGN